MPVELLKTVSCGLFGLRFSAQLSVVFRRILDFSWQSTIGLGGDYIQR